MMRYCAFDLDGVLVDADALHKEALNAALAAHGGPMAVLTEAEHRSTFKGLPTRTKLQMLLAAGRLTSAQAAAVAQAKQQKTIEAIRRLPPDPRKIALLQHLRQNHWQLCVCSNAVRESVMEMLLGGGLLDYLAFWLSNEDAPPKPDPGMYLKAASLFGVPPEWLVVVEDSAPGRASAIAAGCRLVAVAGPAEVGPELIPWIEAKARKETGDAKDQHHLAGGGVRQAVP